MSTFTGPDLTQARLALERLMDDTCLIERDESGPADDVLDQDTGALTPPVGALEPVYEGRCKINAQQGTGREGNRGVGQFMVVNYQLAIPVSGPEIEVGDWVTWTFSRRDELAVGRRFKVLQPIYSTFSTTRKATLAIELMFGD